MTVTVDVGPAAHIMRTLCVLFMILIVRHLLLCVGVFVCLLLSLGNIISRRLRARRALMLFKDVPLRTRMAQLLYKDWR